MTLSMAQQTEIFLWSVVFGFALGAFYDVFRILRLIIPTGTIAAFVEDTLFWLISAFSTFLFILNINSGEIRWYILLGIFAGALIYHVSIGALVVRFSKALIALIHKLAHLLANLFRKPARAVRSKMRRGARAGRAKTKKISRKLIKPFQFCRERCKIISKSFTARKSGRKRKKAQQEHGS